MSEVATDGFRTNETLVALAAGWMCIYAGGFVRQQAEIAASSMGRWAAESQTIYAAEIAAQALNATGSVVVFGAGVMMALIDSKIPRRKPR